MDLRTFYLAYLLIMLATATLNAILTTYGWRHREAPGTTGFIAIMIASGGYALFNILVIIAPTPASTILIAKIGFVFAAAVAPTWLFFALQFSRRRRWLTWQRQAPLVAPQVVILIAVWTNEWHRAAWSSYIFHRLDEFVLMDVTFGPVMWLGYGYTVLTVIAGALVLVITALSGTRLYRRQVWFVLVAVSFPLLISLLYVFRVVDMLNVDFTPLGFALSGLAVVWGLWRYRPFQLAPTARAVLIEMMEDGVIILNREQEVIDVNDAAQRILELPSSGVIGYPASRVLPEWLNLPRTTASPQTAVIDVRRPQADKSWSYFELKITPIQDERMVLAGWILLLYEITQRKRVETQLRRQAQELETLSRVSTAVRTAETMNAMMQESLTQAVHGLQAAFGSIFLWDEARERLCVRAVYPPPLSEMARAAIFHRAGEGITGRVAVTGERYVTENVRQDKLANILPAELPVMKQMRMKAQISLPLRVQEAVLGVMHIGLREERPFRESEIQMATAVADITAGGIHRALVLQGLEDEVTRRAGEIQAEQEKQAIILNSVNDAIVMTDLERKINYVNQGFISLTGYEADAVQQQDVLALLGEAMQESQRHLLQQALQEGRSWQGEVTLTGRNGRLYEAALVAAPVSDGDGLLIGFVFSHHDISHLKELKRARQQFMINVSHQLRTPVANIKLYTDLLRMEQSQGDKRDHYLGVLAAQTARLEHLVQDILEMTALDGGRGLLTWEPLAVEPLIKTMGARYRERAAEQGIELMVQPPARPLPPIQGDQNRLIQALSELLTNALTFTPAGGRITLSAHLMEAQGRETVAINVQDSGPGVPAAERDQIFERFYRGRQAADGSINGSGLGLSLVREIMRLHGGKVTVRSRVEAGSRFTLWLPALSPQARAPSDADDEIA